MKPDIMLQDNKLFDSPNVGEYFLVAFMKKPAMSYNDVRVLFFFYKNSTYIRNCPDETGELWFTQIERYK